jgi:Protein of unknown function (DUF3105)
VNLPALEPIIPGRGTRLLLHFGAVSSRQEEKQRRREERLARERAEKAAATRRKRVQLAAGGLIGIAAIAAVVALAVSGFGGGDEQEVAATPEAADVALPEQQIGELSAAAEAAGCRVQDPEIEGAQHEDKEFQAADYKTNPPTSGNHNPDWYEDGVYESGGTPRLGMIVHTLEHGRIDVQYKPGTPAETVRQLEAFLAEQSDGYHMLLFENTTGMEAQVAATAWGHSVTCPRMNDQVFDVLRTFRAQYIDKGPENVP